MIPRILVPKNARPVVSPTDAPPRRLSSDLDARTLVPSNLPQFELDPHSSIPSYFKLEVLGNAVVVPRDMPTTPLDAISKTPDYVPLTILDSRVAVPKGRARVQARAQKQLVAIQDLPDVLDPDVLTTGEVNLMTQPVEERTEAWNTVARIASIAFHFVVILLILFAPKIFPYHPPTDAEIARNYHRSLHCLPTSIDSRGRLPPRSPRAPVMKRRSAPPAADCAAARGRSPLPRPPEPPSAKLQAAPEARRSSAHAPLSQPHPAGKPDPASDASARRYHASLVLPRFSPGKALQEIHAEALKDGGSRAPSSEDPSAGSRRWRRWLRRRRRRAGLSGGKPSRCSRPPKASISPPISPACSPA